MHPNEVTKLFEMIEILNQKLDRIVNEKKLIRQPRSEQINELAAAFALAQADYPQIGFNRAGVFKNKYSDLDAIMYVIRPILGKHGLSFFCDTMRMPDEQDFIYAQLLHKSGQYVSSFCKLTLDSMQKNPNHAYASSLTYMKRQQALALLNITCTEDPMDDDDSHIYPDPIRVPEKPTLVRTASDPVYETITKEQWEHLSNLLKDHPDIGKDILARMKLNSFRDFPKNQFEAAVKKINELIYEYKNLKAK